MSYAVYIPKDVTVAASNNDMPVPTAFDAGSPANSRMRFAM